MKKFNVLFCYIYNGNFLDLKVLLHNIINIVFEKKSFKHYKSFIFHYLSFNKNWLFLLIIILLIEFYIIEI